MSNVIQTEPIRIQFALRSAKLDQSARLTIFALLARGILEETIQGALSLDDAVRRFFNFENANYVRKNLKSELAEEIMARSLVLPNFANVLGIKRGKIELASELNLILRLCNQILHSVPRVRSDRKRSNPVD